MIKRGTHNLTLIIDNFYNGIDKTCFKYTRLIDSFQEPCLIQFYDNEIFVCSNYTHIASIIQIVHIENNWLVNLSTDKRRKVLMQKK